MKEKIEDIAKNVARHRELELAIEATNNAVGRSMTLYNNNEQQFWIINKQATIVNFERDIVGDIIPTAGFVIDKTLKNDGFPIPRDSKLGGLLIQFHEGKHKYQTPMGEIEIEIFNRTTYSPSWHDDEKYATDIHIRLAGDSESYFFQTIAKILSLQTEIDRNKKKLDQATTDRERQQLIERIEEKETEQKHYLERKQSFIRKSAELRYQPILDPFQESIKRSKIFEGSLIINGGPGTGKTTLLIQRIKFLFSPTIEEYFKLTLLQRDILYNQKTSWIFYSPNELLALYLRNNMQKEELLADTKKVKVWASHKNELVKTYRLVDTTTKGPFLIYNKLHSISLFSNEPKSVQNIIRELYAFYFHFQNDKINRIIGLNVSLFKWKDTGLSIQKYLNNKQNINDLDKLIYLFLNLNEIYRRVSDTISEEYSTLIKHIAGEIQVSIMRDSERVTTLSDILMKWKNDSRDADEDDDSEIESEYFDEKKGEQTSFDFEGELFIKLKSLCRKQALKKLDINTRLNRRDKDLLQLLPEVEQHSGYDSLGQTAYFKKFFERITKGIAANIFREIPVIYKKFRREQFESNSKDWNINVLEELVKDDKNSRIHSDEQALLLYFINGICSQLAKTNKNQYENLNHPYIKAFKEHCKPIIGIDEATDFALIDLLAITSFKHPDISSVILSGDLMQRMTFNGINSWEEYSNIVTDTEKKNLEISYRQSPTLLALAKAIYEKSTGIQANYRSYIKKDELEPEPLMFVSQNEDDKLNWMADRILEIYKTYEDSIPSIAIFLPTEDLLGNFAKKLGRINALADVGIHVKACRNGEVLGDENTVRVFSIDTIKGLEFEAVFFYNIDDLQNQNLIKDLLLKYLYVGLSRATFYLGLTMSGELSNDIAFIASYFNRTKNTWMNL